jgi:hypothetical protein
MGFPSRLPRLALAALIGAAVLLATAASASARPHVQWMDGADAPGTPSSLDKVGVLKIGPRKAPNILVLNPGTSAGSTYFTALARTVAREADGWQVWSVERRENLLEDQSVFNRAKRGKASPEEVFDYYLRWLTDRSITDHVQPVPNSEVVFAKKWGMRVEIRDLRKVVRAAERRGRHVVVGGHSLGGSITTAYATWDFDGRPGARGLSGLVFIDGGSSPDPVSEFEARTSLNDLRKAPSPWLSFGGIPAPFAGLFGVGGGISTKMVPDEPSLAQDWPGLPSNLRPPVPVTNEAQFGYAADVETSPESLRAFQVHAGHLQGGNCDPCGWVRDGAITPIQRYARMIAGWRLQDVDGTAWYHPMRLTIDSGAVGDGNPNPAQDVLGVKATHGDDVHVPIYAFAAALGDGRVVDAARALARQSDLPRRDVTIVDRRFTYSHNDPSSAFPQNAFVNHLLPFLERVSR